MPSMVWHSVYFCKDAEYLLEHVGLPQEFHQQSNSEEKCFLVTNASLSFKYDGKNGGVSGTRWLIVSLWCGGERKLR